MLVQSPEAAKNVRQYPMYLSPSLSSLLNKYVIWQNNFYQVCSCVGMETAWTASWFAQDWQASQDTGLSDLKSGQSQADTS